MPAFSIEQRIGEWIADVITTETLISGEDFGYAVTMGSVPSPAGNVVTWDLLLTLRSPFLGHDALGASARVQANVPSEPGVRQFTAASITVLREKFEQEKREGLSPGNGHAALPPGLKGLKL